MVLEALWITNGTDRPFYARREFDVKGEIRAAKALVSGLGQFNFYLNGSKVSDHVLDPGWTDYNKLVQYVEFDITDKLRHGRNAAGIEVGNGWYIMDTDPEHGYSFHFPPFMPENPNPYKPFGAHLVALVQIEIEYADGSRGIIVTDGDWRTKEHEVVWSNVYGSEYLSGKRKQKGFSESGFDDAGWDRASVATDDAPKGELSPQTQPEIRVIKEYKAKKIGSVAGKTVYDLGQNISGMLSVKLKGEPGDTVSFYPAEKLGDDGLPDQFAKNWMPIDCVIRCEIAGDGDWESFEQTFTYFAGRYIAAEGDAGIMDLAGRAVSSAWKSAGSFNCSNERYQKIYDMIERTVEANMLSVHTDCPTIERFAWQEPNHLMGAAIMFMKDGYRLWDKFLLDMRTAQHTAEDYFLDMEGGRFYPGEGLIPSQAPCYIPNVLPVPGMGSFYDIVAWGSALILGARWHYLFYGDRRIIEDNYDAGMRYLEHLKGKVNEEGFLCHGLGDWGNPDQSYARENIETAFLYADAKTLAYFAEVLGREEDREKLSAYAEKVRDNYNEKLLIKDNEGRRLYMSWDKRDEGIVSTQSVQALPLYWGMVPEAYETDVAEALKKALISRGALVAGEVGLPYVIQSASRYGMDDLIAEYITRDTHPSYYAFIADGETTLGEYWETNPRSHCHDMMGHIAEWYYTGIAGIKIEEPGFAKIRLDPHMPEDMDEFVCTYDTPRGTIRVSGRRENCKAEYSFDIPEGIEVIGQEG